MGMNLFELHSYSQFPYEYVKESLMLKSRIIHWKGKKKNFSSSYVKLSTVATTLANEAGLFPENYVAISGKLQNQKWILYCSSYFANLKASKDVLWHFQLNGSSKLLQSNCINFWKQEKPSSLVLLLFPYRNTFFLYRNIFFPFLYGNIWKYRRKKKKLCFDSYKTLCFETQMHEVALQISTFKNIETVDRRYSTMFSSVWKTVDIIHSITCTNHGYRSQFALKSLSGSSHSVLQWPLPLASSSDNKEQTNTQDNLHIALNSDSTLTDVLYILFRMSGIQFLQLFICQKELAQPIKEKCFLFMQWKLVTSLLKVSCICMQLCSTPCPFLCLHAGWPLFYTVLGRTMKLALRLVIQITFPSLLLRILNSGMRRQGNTAKTFKVFTHLALIG